MAFFNVGPRSLALASLSQKQGRGEAGHSGKHSKTREQRRFRRGQQSVAGGLRCGVHAMIGHVPIPATRMTTWLKSDMATGCKNPVHHYQFQLHCHHPRALQLHAGLEAALHFCI
jgi:hypothetical protein